MRTISNPPIIPLPPKTPGESNVNLADSNILVIVGANGAGKTKLGRWIEDNASTSHRVSAQRALDVPESLTPQFKDAADKQLWHGHPSASNRSAHRWGSRPETHQLNDYQLVLSSLFARHSQRDADAIAAMRPTQTYIEPGESELEAMERIWRLVFPHRTITAEPKSGRIQAAIAGRKDTSYPARDMSDGERVALYLMGQCLCAPAESVFIVDEPENHLHRSIMLRLWDELQRERSDCSFVYITHDLDFAASRRTAKILYVIAFDPATKWTWDFAPDISGLPAEVTLEILGNRKPVLFVEGEHGSFDHLVYQEVYPDHYVVPRGSCEKVIEATKALRSMPSLHHLEVVGLIDRDYRTTSELVSLKRFGVFATDVAEIENLFCLKEILEAVAGQVKLGADKVAAASDFIINELKREREVQISAHVCSEVRYLLNKFDGRLTGQTEISAGVQGLASGIDVPLLWSVKEKEIDAACDSGDLAQCLKLFNRKSLSARIGPYFGLAHNAYPELVLRLLASKETGPGLRSAIKLHLPNIEGLNDAVIHHELTN